MSRHAKPIKSIYNFSTMLKRFWPELKKYKGLLLGSFLALIAEVLLRILEPWPLKFIFDKVFSSHADVALEPSFLNVSSWNVTTTLLIFSVAVVILAGLRALMAYVNTIGFALAGNRIMTKVRNDLYTHIQSLGLSFHTRSRSGDLLIRLMGDVGLLQEVSVTAVLPLLANTCVLFGMLIVMLWVNWQLALIALTIIPLFWLSTFRISNRLREVSKKQRKIQGAMAATAAESVTGIKTVQALSLEDVFKDKFTGTSQKDLKEGVRAKRLAAKLERTVDLLIAIATAMVLFFGGRFVLEQEMTPGDLLVFLAYLKNAFKPLRNFAKYTGRLAKASAAGERVFSILDIAPDIQNSPDAYAAPVLKGKVEFNQVQFAYNHGKTILNNVSFTVQPGEHIAVIAPSGAGKSTLMNLLLRLYDPTRGVIKIDDQDIKNYTVESLRSQISVVLQDTLLFSANVYENIAYGAPGATKEEIIAAARLANADTFINDLPAGYETILGERGSTLSSGQRQRIAIARAAIRQSPILILDEPTTGLDKENEQEVSKALRNVSQGRTTFMITHNLNLSVQADSILFIKHGKIYEQGSHEKLMEVQGEYAQLFQLQEQTGG